MGKSTLHVWDIFLLRCLWNTLADRQWTDESGAGGNNLEVRYKYEAQQHIEGI